MSMDAQGNAREEMNGLLREWRDAVDALAEHHATADYDPDVHDQAWMDKLVELENAHREAYDGLISRWPYLLPELNRFKLL